MLLRTAYVIARTGLSIRGATLVASSVSSTARVSSSSGLVSATPSGFGFRTSIISASSTVPRSYIFYREIGPSKGRIILDTLEDRNRFGKGIRHNTLSSVFGT